MKSVGLDRISGSSRKTVSRREVLAGSVAIGAMLVLRGERAWAADGKKTFTILHTNDLHSNLIGMAPATDYTPFTLNDDKTRGGFARLRAEPTVRRNVYGAPGVACVKVYVNGVYVCR